MAAAQDNDRGAAARARGRVQGGRDRRRGHSRSRDPTSSWGISMTDVSMARIQWTYRCPFPECPHVVQPPRLRCAVHAMLDDWNHLLAESPVFEASRRWTYSRLRVAHTRWQQERN